MYYGTEQNFNWKGDPYDREPLWGHFKFGNVLIYQNNQYMQEINKILRRDSSKVFNF